MRISCITVVALALTSTSLAAPVKRGLMSTFMQTVKNVVVSTVGPNAFGTVTAKVLTFPNAAANAIQLAVALVQTHHTLSQISITAEATGNHGVKELVSQGQNALSNARKRLLVIGQSIGNSEPPSTADMKEVAESLKIIVVVVNTMAAAVTTSDSTLSGKIANMEATRLVLQGAGMGLMSTTNTTFASMGLPDNYATA